MISSRTIIRPRKVGFFISGQKCPKRLARYIVTLKLKTEDGNCCIVIRRTRTRKTSRSMALIFQLILIMGWVTLLLTNWNTSSTRFQSWGFYVSLTIITGLFILSPEITKLFWVLLTMILANWMLRYGNRIWKVLVALFFKISLCRCFQGMMKNWLLILSLFKLFLGKSQKSILRKSKKEGFLLSLLELKRNIGISMLRKKYSSVEISFLMNKATISMFFIRFGSGEGCWPNSRSKKGIWKNKRSDLFLIYYLLLLFNIILYQIFMSSYFL